MGAAFTVNYRTRRNVRQAMTLWALAGALLCILAMPARVFAQATGRASATVNYESNSNLFAVDTGLGQPVNGAGHGSSTDLSYSANFEGDYKLSRQEFYGSARIAQYNYIDVDEDLNHYEYSFDTGLRWNLADSLTGTFDVSRSRSMVPFLDLTGSDLELSVQTSQQESAVVNYKLGSQWQLVGTAQTGKSTQPVAAGFNGQIIAPGSPDQELTQSGGTASLQYAGVGPLVSGVVVGYLTGDEASVNGLAETSYSQSTVGFVSSYKLIRTTFNGEVGYTRRTSGDGRDNAHGLTGSVSFTDQLTTKTSFSVNLARAINTLYLNLGSEVDTNAGVNLNWQATRKIGIGLGYRFSYRAFPGYAAGSDIYPVDYEHSANLSISYQPTRWLSITPYANYDLRRSNVLGRDYDSNVYGVTLTASVGNTPRK